jgi:hypothetical protein
LNDIHGNVMTITNQKNNKRQGGPHFTLWAAFGSLTMNTQFSFDT